MIRLYCLAQGMRKLTKYEVNALIKGNEYFSKLIKVLPWVMPRKSRYDMFQCMMMCGITRREFKYVIQDVPPDHTLTRIKNYPNTPDAYIIPGHNTLDDDDYITTLQAFWYTTLAPLQIGPWAQEEPTPLVKMYWCQKIARENAYALVKAGSVLNPSWNYAINNLQSLAKISHIDCLYEYTPENYPGLSKGNYYRWFDMYQYYTFTDKKLEPYTHPELVERALDMYYSMSDLIDEIYMFLYHCDMFGFVNDYMIGGDWLYES